MSDEEPGKMSAGFIVSFFVLKLSLYQTVINFYGSLCFHSAFVYSFHSSGFNVVL